MSDSIEAFDFLLVRTPSLPMEEIEHFNAVSTFHELSCCLSVLLKRYPEILEAISYSSLEFSQTIAEWTAGKIEFSEKQFSTLYKYVARMITRATPFGGFAGVFSGTISEKPSSIRLTGRSSIHERPSMDFLGSQIPHIVKDRSLQEKLSFFPNTSIHEWSDHYRFARYKIVNGKRIYQWISLKKNIVLQNVYSVAKEEPSFKKIKAHLCDMGIEPEKAVAYLDRLIENQFLLSELEPAVTGFDYHRFLLQQIKETAKPCLQARDGIILTKNRSANQEIERHRKENKQIVQADKKIIPQHANLKQSTINIIAKELAELAPFFVREISPDLKRFSESFLKRYDLEMVPLLEALDGDMGIGYGNLNEQYRDENPLLNNLGNLGNIPLETNNFAEKVFASSTSICTDELDLQTVELPNLIAEETGLPPTFYAIGNILSKNEVELDNGNFQFNLNVCTGPSCLNLMTRFAYMDKKLTQKLKQCAQFEASRFPDAVIGEIVHFPDNKVGNILQRPVLHEYEIPFLGRSTVPKSRQILPSDILVFRRDGKILLWSKSLNKRIIPRLSCAHNFRTGVSMYRFLCDLQTQESSLAIHWDWRKYKDRPRLPRVIYKHIILSRARWFLNHRDLKKESDVKAYIKEFISKHHVPEEILLAEGDNELFINLNTEWGLQLLIEKLKKGHVILYEFLSRNSGIIKDIKNRSYANEVIIPFKSAFTDPITPRQEQVAGRVARTFLPGSEWIYLKLYCSRKSADDILRDRIFALTETLKNEKLISKWFFIRYYDPDFHLRIRFLNSSGDAYSIYRIMKRIDELLKPLQVDKKIWKIQYDTYFRELERYGEAHIAFSESLFHYDSIAVLQVLRNLRIYGAERWQFALAGINQLFDLFQISLSNRLFWTDHWSAALKKEFHMDKQQEKQLNLDYRNRSKEIEKAISEGSALFNDPLSHRKKAISEAMDWHGKQGMAITEALLGSFCHMFLNRLFFSDQRANELVVYHYLAKHYLSSIARDKKQMRIET